MRGNKITSSEGLSDLHDLKTLYFSENLLRSVEDISSMKGLVRLHLRDNNIRRLDGFLQGLPNLQYLNLRYARKDGYLRFAAIDFFTLRVCTAMHF